MPAGPSLASEGATLATLTGVTRTIAAVLTACVLLMARPQAHEIPNEVTVQSFLRPEGQTLVFLVRAPLKAMRDVDIPLLPNGFLDLTKVGPTLEDAAMLWIGDFVELFEDGQPLGKPRVAAARVSLPSDKSFASFAEAQASLTGPRLPDDTELYWQDGLLDVRFEYPIRSDRARFAVLPGLTRLGVQVNVVLRLLMPDTPSGCSTCTATPASWSSTRAGIRRCCASRATASSTSSTASTTCCSCSAS